MKLIQLLKAPSRPEFVFRPSQSFRALAFVVRSHSAEYESLRLPWGSPLRVRPSEYVGSDICQKGVHELAVCEVIGRLVDPGEVAVDVGANIGQMASIMAMRAGSNGKVIAFEPHPALFAELQHNIASWEANPHMAPTIAENAALSDNKGTAKLVLPPSFAWNRGTAFLGNGIGKSRDDNSITARTEVLDCLLEDSQVIGLLKVDVERHELQVLRGAEQLLSSRRIRDILFEETAAPPSPVTDYLEGKGYTIYSVGLKLLGPTITPLTEAGRTIVARTRNYLATLDPGRAQARLSRRGWRMLSARQYSF